MLFQPRQPQRIGLTRVLRLVKVISIWVVDIYTQVTVWLMQMAISVMFDALRIFGLTFCPRSSQFFYL